MSKTIVIVGAGIAGISVIEGLLQEYDEGNQPFDTLVLVSASRLTKKINNFQVKGRNLESYDVTEQAIEELALSIPSNLKFISIIGNVQHVDTNNKLISYIDLNSLNGEILVVNYDVICICNGASPKSLSISSKDGKHIEDKIIVLRDIDTVKTFREKLHTCRHLVIVGNGGISLELISKVSNCGKTWIVRDESIGTTFFDSGAAKFLLESTSQTNDLDPIVSRSRVAYSVDKVDNAESSGPAIGPYWLQDFTLDGKQIGDSKLNIHYKDEVIVVESTPDQEYPLEIITRSGRTIACDLIVSAIGVDANKLGFIGPEPDWSSTREGGGWIIDEEMRTSIEGIYAAGDVVSCEKWPADRLWFQMRLWTQARQMGFYAGRCIVSHLNGSDPSIYSNYDCFTHCTSFFGYKLVLLGRFNCQHMSSEEEADTEILVRVNPGKTYVKLVITGGKISGAVLIGDTGLEETIENLIYDKIDIENLKDQILNDTFDLDDYFD